MNSFTLKWRYIVYMYVHCRYNGILNSTHKLLQFAGCLVKLFQTPKAMSSDPIKETECELGKSKRRNLALEGETPYKIPTLVQRTSSVLSGVRWSRKLRELSLKFNAAHYVKLRTTLGMAPQHIPLSGYNVQNHRP